MKYLAAAVSRVGLIGAAAPTGADLVDPSNHFQGPRSHSPLSRDPKSKLDWN